MDAILYSLISAFVAWELTAHYLLHNRQGHTLSNRIKAVEARYGLPARIIVAVAVVVLGVHLEI